MPGNMRKRWVHCLGGALLLLLGGYVLQLDAIASPTVPPAPTETMAPGDAGGREGPATVPGLPAKDAVTAAGDDVDVDPVQCPAALPVPVAPKLPAPAAAAVQRAVAGAADPAVRPAAKPVQLAKMAAPASTAIVRSLQQKGTPKANYKVSEADDDIVLDAVALTVGPEEKAADRAPEAKSKAAAPASQKKE